MVIHLTITSLVLRQFLNPSPPLRLTFHFQALQIAPGSSPSSQLTPALSAACGQSGRTFAQPQEGIFFDKAPITEVYNTDLR